MTGAASGRPASGSLYMLPCGLLPGTAAHTLPPQTLEAARRIRSFLAENAKSARAFLKEIGHPQPLQTLNVVEIGHHPAHEQIEVWLQPAIAGDDVAVLSEAGCPGIADPGAQIVARAHALGLAVVPLVGPSAPLLALMGSGLNGQCFRFVGYLPQDGGALSARIRELEQASARGETQLFIETPYRNERLFESLLAVCRDTTQLAVAVDLTGTQQDIRMRRIGAWRTLPAGERPALQRRPAVFALLAQAAGAGAPKDATPRPARSRQDASTPGRRAPRPR
jgi:16S rRNA (cytidine1402-2'-O)-methyltransferase